jgi:hypothetical protein
MKKILIPVLSVSLAVLSAFSTKSTTSVFTFTGVSSDPDQRIDPNRYTPGTPANCSGTENVLCAIDATPDNAGKPMIGTSGALFNALDNGGLAVPDFAPSAVKGKP